MEFFHQVRVAIGSLSLIFALVTGLGSIIIIIAMVRNPLHLTHKPVERIVRAQVALYFTAGTIFLPYFGITEILRGTDAYDEEAEIFPSFESVMMDFLVGSKFLLQLLINLERFTAYAHPHLHRQRFTKRLTTLLSVLLVTFSLLFSLLSLTGIPERIYYGVFIHLFASCTWLAFIAITLLTYRNLKHRRSRVIPADEASSLPHLRKRTEMERARNALGARKYLLQVAIFSLPFKVSILPWYLVKFISILNRDLLATKAGCFWQRFSVPLAFITDPFFLTRMIFHGYAGTLKIIFCGNWSPLVYFNESGYISTFI